MKHSNLSKLLALFGCSVVVSVISYVIIGFVLSHIENAYINNSVPISQLEQFNQQLVAHRRTTQTLRVVRFYIHLFIFPLFAVFAVKPSFEWTKSYFLSFIIIIFFAGFPIIFFIVFAFIFISIYGVHFII